MFNLVVDLPLVVEDRVPALLRLVDQSVQVGLHKITHDGNDMQRGLRSTQVYYVQGWANAFQVNNFAAFIWPVTSDQLMCKRVCLQKTTRNMQIDWMKTSLDGACPAATWASSCRCSGARSKTGDRYHLKRSPRRTCKLRAKIFTQVKGFLPFALQSTA